MKVLIVDDEKPLVIGLTASLKKEGYEVSAAYDGNSALDLIKSHKFDMVLLDIMLPGMDGITLLKKIREFSEVHVIMLTAKDDYADMVLGLELGADDYVTKPFNARVLTARMKAVSRRKSTSVDNPGSKYSIKGLTIDFALRQVLKNDKEIDLTAKEFDILSVLVKNSGVVIPRDRLYEKVWDMPDFDTRTVDVHVSNLREKIEADPSNPYFIRTKWGVGYYFVKETR
jgi:DNA-binding response OmpR family regulator